MRFLGLVLLVFYCSTSSVAGSLQIFFFFLGSFIDLLDELRLSCFDLSIILFFFFLPSFFLSLFSCFLSSCCGFLLLFFLFLLLFILFSLSLCLFELCLDFLLSPVLFDRLYFGRGWSWSLVITEALLFVSYKWISVFKSGLFAFCIGCRAVDKVDCPFVLKTDSRSEVKHLSILLSSSKVNVTLAHAITSLISTLLWDILGSWFAPALSFLASQPRVTTAVGSWVVTLGPLSPWRLVWIIVHNFVLHKFRLMFPLAKSFEVWYFVSKWIVLWSYPEISVTSTVPLSCIWIVWIVRATSPWLIWTLCILKFTVLSISLVGIVTSNRLILCLTFAPKLLLEIWIVPQQMLSLVVSYVLSTGFKRTILLAYFTHNHITNCLRRCVFALEKFCIPIYNTLSVRNTHSIRGFWARRDRGNWCHLHLLLQEILILKLVHDGLEQILVLILLLIKLVS